MKYKRGKRLLGFMLVFFLCFFLYGESSFATTLVTGGEEGDYGPDTVAESYCVINGDTGEIILSKNKDEKLFPASTTKVLTALLVIEQVKDLDSIMTFTKTGVAVDPSSSTLPSKAVEGEQLSVRDALYGLLLSSANECGAMLAEYVSGTQDKFVDLMNERVAEIGAKNTHFANSYGIHDKNHYTTAYDMCLIFQECMKNETFQTIESTEEYIIPATNKCGERVCTTGHAMLNGDILEQGVIGGKTGRTPQAGRTLVTAVKRDGLYTISMLMKSDDENFYLDEQVLLEYTYGLHNGSLPEINWEECKGEVTATDNVKMRYSPSVKCGVFSTLVKGGKVLRLAEYNHWSQIEFEGKIYYVSSAYLTPESGATSEETEQESSHQKETETTESPQNTGDSYTLENQEATQEAASSGLPAKTILIISISAGIAVVFIVLILVIHKIIKKKKEQDFWKL